MKRFVIFSLLLALLATAAGAMALQTSPEEAARAAVPENAQFLRTERDDGLTVYHYQTPDGTRYEASVDPASSSVVRLEIDAADTRGSSAAVLTAQEAEQALLAIWPEAVIHLVYLDRDDGRYEYDISFTTPDFAGRAELNAESGALLEADLNYAAEARIAGQGPLNAEQARELALSLVEGSRIVEFETDRDDGRTVYEGELQAESVRYEFVIDAETGRVIEWEIDR